jgi:UDPglucose 6-dehydrogenase
MEKKISVIGSGYVGLVTGMGLVELGHNVTFIDIDQSKIEQINQGKPPIFEEGLEELMQKQKGRYRATSDYITAICDTDITFISVGTPSNDDGSIDLCYIEESAKELGKVLKEKDDFHVVVIKSTVIPGTTDDFIRPILEEHSNRTAFVDFGLAMNPEFLREGVALDDFRKPDRIVIGYNDDKTKSILEELYSSFSKPLLFVDIKTAEMIKYTSNSFLATKISFANEIGNVCKQLGIDTYKVFEGVGLDHRINPNFFRAGVGFGGSCFPKDVLALIYKTKDINEIPRVLQSTMDVNDQQPIKLVELLQKHVPELNNKVIGLLGLAFKPDSDDIRETRAAPIVDLLLSQGASVFAYDPLAMDNFKKLYPQIDYASSAEEVINKCEAIILQTDWPEFEQLDYSSKIVVDGRRIEKARSTAQIYEGLCW